VVCGAVFVRHDPFSGAVFVDKHVVGLAVGGAGPEIERLHPWDVGGGEPQGEGGVEENVVGGEGRGVGEEAAVGELCPVRFGGVGDLSSLNPNISMAIEEGFERGVPYSTAAVLLLQ